MEQRTFTMNKHMNRSSLAVILLALSLGASPARAGDCDHVITSNEARTENAITATKIPWETSLEKAKAKSAASGKPILWVHMLGNIDGYT
jgi:hypothetical protein